MNREQLKKLVTEQLNEMGYPSDMPKQDHDHEGRMHRSSLFKMAKYSVELLDMIQDEDDLPEWVESKITKAADYLGVVKHYLEADDARDMGALEEMEMHDEGNTTYATSRLNKKPVPSDKLGKSVASLASSIAKGRDSIKKEEEEITSSEKNKLKKMSKKLKSSSKLHAAQADQIEDIIDEDILEEYYATVDENYTIYDVVQDAITEDDELACPQCLYEVLSDASCGCPDLVYEAEYRGRKVTLNKPTRGDVKKFKVFVKDPKTGNVKKVNFGDPNMRIKKSNPKRRKSFRARHNCKNPGPKTKARYWSCRKW